MSQEKKYAIYSTINNEFVDFAELFLKSIQNSYPDHPQIIFLYSQLTEKSKSRLLAFEKVSMRKVDFSSLNHLPPLNRSDIHLESGIYYARLLLWDPDFDDFDKIIYIDMDTLILRSFEALWKLEDFYIVYDEANAGRSNLFMNSRSPELNEIIEDLGLEVSSIPCANSGLFLLPRKHRTKENLQQLYRLANDLRSHLKLSDQSVISVWLNLKNHSLEKNTAYNCQFLLLSKKILKWPCVFNASVLHFNGMRNHERFQLMRDLLACSTHVNLFKKIMRTFLSQIQILRRTLNFLRLLRAQLQWFAKAFPYICRMALKNPSVLLNYFWQRDLYPKPEVVHFSDTQKAAEIFNRYGYVVVANALTQDEIQSLKDQVYTKALEMVELDKKGLLPAECKHGSLRYSYGDYKHQSNWEYLASNPRIVDILREIWRGEDFSAVTAGGDFVLPGGIYQPIHSDMGWASVGERAKIITVNYYVTDVNKENGPIRQVPGTQYFPVPSPFWVKFEPRWMKECTVTAQAGIAIIRDPRAWHGGTPNISSEIRCMPNCGYVLDSAKLSEIGKGGVYRRLQAGKYVQRFKNTLDKIKSKKAA